MKRPGPSSAPASGDVVLATVILAAGVALVFAEIARLLAGVAP